MAEDSSKTQSNDAGNMDAVEKDAVNVDSNLSPVDQAIKLFEESSDKNDEIESANQLLTESNNDKIDKDKKDVEKQKDADENNGDKEKDKQGDGDKKDGDKKDGDKDTSKLSALEAAVEKETRFQFKRQELESRAKEAERQAAELKASFDELKKNPLNFMQQLGLDLDTVLKVAANPEEAKKLQSANDGTNAMKEVERLREEIQRRDQHEKESKAISEFVRKIGEHIDGDASAYPLINYTDKAKEQVLDTVNAYYEQHGEILPIEKAAEHVERELRAMADKWFESPYIQSKIAKLKVNGNKGDGKSDGPRKENESGSLSNSMTQATALKELTEEQRKALAIKMFAERSVDME